MSPTPITREVAARVLSVVDAGLVSGVGRPIPGQMCVEAAVCFALGEPHGDEPSCVDPAIRALKIRLNDARWPSDAARTVGMRRLALLQLGTRDNFDSVAFARAVALKTINVIVPLALRATEVESLETHAKACEEARTLEEGRAAVYRAAAYAASATACTAAAARAAYAAYTAAAFASTASAYAASAASAAAALQTFADLVADILISMNVPGVEWLDLLEGAEA